MRKLMLFAIGFTVSAVLSAYILSGSALWILAAVTGIPALTLLFVKKKSCKMIAITILGLSFGCIWCRCFDIHWLSTAKAYDGRSAVIEMTASDYSFDTGYGSAVDGKVILEGKKYSVRLYYQDHQAVEPGDLVSCRAKLTYTADGISGESTYHKGEGIFLLAYGNDGIQVTAGDSHLLKYFPARLRKTVSNRISEIFPESTAPFAKALLLGEDSQISFQDNMSLQKSGIRHVIAVSGLHVAILFSVLYFFTGRERTLTLLIGFPLLLLFAAVAGFSPSVVRACLMQALVVLAVAADQEYDPPTALSFAALVILLINPLSITSVSFQLSFGSMIGIALFSQRILDFFKDKKRFGDMKGKSLKARLKRWFAGSISVSLGAMFVTIPLCAVYFGTVSIIGIITNLVTLWVISFIFCGIMLACVLSVLWMPLGTIIGYVVSVPIHYVLLCARLLSAVPFGVAYTESIYTVLWIVLSTVLMILYFVVKKKNPLLLFGTLAVLYALSITASWVEPRLDNVRLTVLDVGQGQCILLQSKDGAYLIDCGGSNGERTAEAALQALGAQGITQLDGLILTHYDADHANGAANLCQVFPVKQLYLPDTDRGNDIRTDLEEQEDILWVRRKTELSCGVGKIVIYPSKNDASGNESSMCILFQGENCDILITGDRDIEGESHLLEQANLPELDVLVVGHHGAETSTGLELLYETKPKIAVISVGENNYHGHPDSQVLSRLKNSGCVIRRTDLEGTIIIRG